MALETLETTAASLTLTTGEMLSLQPGTNHVLTRLEGWFSPAGTRRESTSRLWAHGSFSERGWREQRLISVGGHIFCETRSEAAAMTDTLAAALADGTAGKFIVNDLDLGYREAEVFVTGQPDVRWDGNLDIFFDIDMVAPDPRKYGKEITLTTKASSPGGGLAMDLFTGAPFSAQRTNYATNPRAISATGFATYLPGAGEDGTTTYVTSASDGPLPDLDSYARRTVTVAKTSGSTGWRGATTNRTPLTGVENDTVTGSVYIRYTGPSPSITGYMRTQVYDGAGASVTLANSAAYTLNSGQWYRVTSTVTATGAFESVEWWFYQTSANALPAGSTVDVTGLQVETSPTMSTYFDGYKAASGQTSYAWLGDPDASASVEQLPTGYTGVLDFGAAGSPGTITVENTGTADTAPIFTVRGYSANGFTITHLESGARLTYVSTLGVNQTLVINAADGSVLLDGYADRSAFLTRREWTRIPGKTRATYFFESLTTGAQLTIGVQPAWW